MGPQILVMLCGRPATRILPQDVVSTTTPKHQSVLIPHSTATRSRQKSQGGSTRYPVICVAIRRNQQDKGEPKAAYLERITRFQSGQGRVRPSEFCGDVDIVQLERRRTTTHSREII